MADFILELHKIDKSYAAAGGGKLEILKGVELKVKAGEKVAIVGPSGSGKSTLLHVAGLLDKADKGYVKVNGERVSEFGDGKLASLRNKMFGFVYQHHYLMRDFDALENVMMPAILAGQGRITAKMDAEAMLEKVGLKARMKHRPGQLSGGEQQRVALARALVNKPKVLLADEPTGNLDPKTAVEVQNLLEELVKKMKMATVIVTHNMELADMCDAVYRMEGGNLVNG